MYVPSLYWFCPVLVSLFICCNLPAQTLQKEYIYVGGKLIAIEEGNFTLALASVPMNLAAVPAPPSGATSTSVDGSHNETDFRLERKTGVDRTWAAPTTPSVFVPTNSWATPLAGFLVHLISDYSASGHSGLKLDREPNGGDLTELSPPARPGNRSGERSAGPVARSELPQTLSQGGKCYDPPGN